MGSGSPSSGAGIPPPALPLSLEPQASNQVCSPTDTNRRRTRYEVTKHNMLDGPQAAASQERLSPAPLATSIVQELASLPTEKEPVFEGLEAYTGVQAIETSLFHQYVTITPFHQRVTLSSLPAFPTAVTHTQEIFEATSSAAAALPAPLASAPAAYLHLKEHTDDTINKHQPKTPQEEEKPPSAVLFAAATQLYHSSLTSPTLRISAAAHFLNLALQSTPEKVASWKDVCSWGAFYGFKTEDLRAASHLVGKQGIILEEDSL